MYKLSMLYFMVMMFICNGCYYYGSSALYENHAKLIRTSEGLKEKDDATHPRCEVRMYGEQLSSGVSVAKIKEKHMGAFLVQLSEDRNQLINGVCIKYEGQEIKLPAAPLIASPKGGKKVIGYRNTPKFEDHFCSRPMTSDEEVQKICTSKELKCCIWNNRFLAAQPFTFLFVSKKGTYVGDYMDFIRIYRNGELSSVWNPGSYQEADNIARIDGSSLVPKSRISPALVPNLSEMDIRIIPHTSTASQNIDTQINTKRSLLTVMKKAVWKGVNELDPSLSDSLNCFANKILDASTKVRQIVNGNLKNMDISDEKCTSKLDANTELSSLSDKYSNFKNGTKERFQQLKQETLGQLSQMEVDIRVEFLKEREHNKLKLASIILQKASPDLSILMENPVQTLKYLELGLSKAGIDTALLDEFNVAKKNFEKAIEYIDKQIATTLCVVDETRDLALGLYDATQDKDAMADAFSAFVRSLDSQDSLFEERKSNPPLAATEVKLHFEYEDPFQVFAFAPWFAVPLRMDDKMEVDFNAAVALPFVDFFGLRWQLGKNRFSDIRLSLGFGYSQSEESDEGKSIHTGISTFSLSFATVRIGYGVVVLEDGKHLGFKERNRIIIGVDLFKLISGKNAEFL